MFRRRSSPLLLLIVAAHVHGCADPSTCIEGDCSGSPADAASIDADPARLDVDADPVLDGGSVRDADDAVDLAPPDSGPAALVRVTVTPTSAVLVSQDGAEPMQVFEVAALYADGSTVAIAQPNVSIEPPLLGTYEPATGIFTANGRFGGAGRLIATVEGVRAEAAIRVRLERTVIVAGTPTAAPSLFSLPGIIDPSLAANILYPLDGAVLPQNVPPAEIQWDRSAPGDVFQVRLSKPNVRTLIYESTAVAGFRDAWEVATDEWRRIAQSEPDEWAEITVDRYVASSGTVIAGSPIRIRFARASLLGSVYYWDISHARVVRIHDGSATRDEFMPSPPLGCIGCHSVSASGRYMAGRFGGADNVGGVFDLTQDLTPSPPPMLFSVTSTTIRWWFSSWSPDDTRLVVSVSEQVANRRLALVDPFRGTFISPAAGALPTGSVTHPAWSPDGASIAYVANANNWGGDNTSGDIMVLPVVGRDAFDPPRLVVTGTTPAGLPSGNAASYPTWSPDSGWIAFAHGNSSRSESGQSALYIVRQDGTGLVRLDKASGGTNGTVSFQPRFSPFYQDGYFWLTFLSRRDYGNGRAGTQGTRRQQLWVTAIKANPAAGEDPSEVPYWLPGQSTGSQNISAYWASRACRGDAETCTVDADCCEGDCGADATGASICLAASGMCRELGENCTANAQCCNRALCVGGTCGGL